MASVHRAEHRQRRRAHRPADGNRINPSWDTPDHGFAIGQERSLDAHRTVFVDPAADEELSTVEFYREQIPPHYGS